jgi:hypothetical protein
MVVALAGRRIDAFGAKPARFPAGNAALVREHIRELLVAHKAGALVSAAACGADLLGQEAAAALGLRRRIVLPLPRAEFRERSVTGRPGDWGPLFDRLLGSLPASDIVEMSRAPQPFFAGNVRILEEAIALGRAHGVPVAAMVVWDLESRGAADVTEHFRREAGARGLEVFDVATL